MELKMKSGSDISMKPDADMVMRKLAHPPLFLWFAKVKFVKSSSFLSFTESTSTFFYCLTHKSLI